MYHLVHTASGDRCSGGETLTLCCHFTLSAHNSGSGVPEIFIQTKHRNTTKFCQPPENDSFAAMLAHCVQNTIKF